MAQILYGATLVQTSGNPSNLRYDIIGDNSEVFYANEIVTLEAGGTMAAQSTTTTVLGVLERAATMTSDNETVAKVHPGYIPADEGIFLMESDADLTSPGSEGLYFPITGAASAQQISVATLGGTTGATGPSRVVEIVKVDPFNEGGTGAGSGARHAYVRFVKTPYSNINITPNL